MKGFYISINITLLMLGFGCLNISAGDNRLEQGSANKLNSTAADSEHLPQSQDDDKRSNKDNPFQNNNNASSSSSSSSNTAKKQVFKPESIAIDNNSFGVAMDNNSFHHDNFHSNDFENLCKANYNEKQLQAAIKLSMITAKRQNDNNASSSSSSSSSNAATKQIGKKSDDTVLNYYVGDYGDNWFTIAQPMQDAANAQNNNASYSSSSSSSNVITRQIVKKSEGIAVNDSCSNSDDDGSYSDSDDDEELKAALALSMQKK